MSNPRRWKNTLVTLHSRHEEVMDNLDNLNGIVYLAAVDKGDYNKVEIVLGGDAEALTQSAAYLILSLIEKAGIEALGEIARLVTEKIQQEEDDAPESVH